MTYRGYKFTYRGSHAGLVPGLQQAVKDSVVLSLRVARVSRRTPQVGLLIAMLLDFTVKVLQRILTVVGPEAQSTHFNTVIVHATFLKVPF